jgi:hypothetical protein
MYTSRITSIEPNGSWTGKFGIMNAYKVELANGHLLNFNAKGEFKYPIGSDISYKITNEEMKNASVIQTEYQNNNFEKNTDSNNKTLTKDQLIIRQTCIKAASELHASKQSSDEMVLNSAKTFLNWING